MLGHLAAVWVRSDPADPGAARLEQSLPFLQSARAKQGLGVPVTMQGVSGASHAQWVLSASRWTTTFLGSQFGCDELVRRVLLAFPRDVPSDPWELELVLAAWRSGIMTVHPRTAALVHTARDGHLRSEFARRLMDREDIVAVLEAVDLGSLAEWVRRTFRPIDFSILRYELAAEFEAAAASFPPPPPRSEGGEDASVNQAVPKPRHGRRPRPRWDPNTRTLYLGDKTIKRYNRGSATNQIDIIEAFENAKWVRAVDDPFGDPKKLNQTLYDLNNTLLAGTIHFRQDGTGETIIWEYAT
jgi:hypothetical protein